MNRKQILFLLQIGNFSVPGATHEFSIESTCAGIVGTEPTATARLISEAYGDVKPPEISDADWAEIKRRHDV